MQNYVSNSGLYYASFLWDSKMKKYLRRQASINKFCLFQFKFINWSKLKGPLFFRFYCWDSFRPTNGFMPSKIWPVFVKVSNSAQIFEIDIFMDSSARHCVKIISWTSLYTLLIYCKCQWFWTWYLTFNHLSTGFQHQRTCAGLQSVQRSVLLRSAECVAVNMSRTEVKMRKVVLELVRCLKIWIQ